MGLRSQSWEYASEMVLKSVHMGLRTDRGADPLPQGPGGATQPPQALRLVFALARGLDQPPRDVRLRRRLLPLQARASLLLALGLLLTLPLSFGPITIGPITFSHHWMLLGVALAVLGLQCVYMGVLSQVFFDYRRGDHRALVQRFPYTRSVAAAAGLFFAGAGAGGDDGRHLRPQRLSPDATSPFSYLGVTGLMLMMAGFTTFTFTLLLHSTAVVVWRSPQR